MGHYHKDMNLVLILFSRCQNVPVRKKNIIFIRSDESPAPKYSETRKADVQKIQNKYIKKLWAIEFNQNVLLQKGICHTLLEEL